jgi:type IV secretion system protein VirB10
VAGERHVSAVAGRRRPWLSKKAALVLLLAATAAACAFVLLRAATRPGEVSAPDEDLQVRAVIRYEPPPAPPLAPAALPVAPPGGTPPGPPQGPPLPAEPPPATLAQALRLAGQEGQPGQPRLLAYGSAGGDAAASAPAGANGQGRTSATAATLPAAAAGKSELEARLQPTRLAGAAAAVPRRQPYLLTTGSILPCVLQTAMDSTLPGLVTCVIPQDVLGKTGLTLLDRGTRVVGEFQGGVRQGQARLFVAWTRAETPQGVIIDLASPAADPLGSTGLPGAVDSRFWQRFGGALLLSLVQGAIQTGNTALAQGGTTSINTGDTQGVIAETLRNTINIPPTVRKNQGELVSIFVARDLDFSAVYDVQPTPWNRPTPLDPPTSLSRPASLTGGPP